MRHHRRAVAWSGRAHHRLPMGAEQREAPTAPMREGGSHIDCPRRGGQVAFCSETRGEQAAAPQPWGLTLISVPLARTSAHGCPSSRQQSPLYVASWLPAASRGDLARREGLERSALIASMRSSCRITRLEGARTQQEQGALTAVVRPAVGKSAVGKSAVIRSAVGKSAAVGKSLA